MSFTILNCANKILTLSYITLITEVFLESIHQRQTKYGWVSHFTLNSVECLTNKDLPGSEEGRDESNGGNLCVFFFFFLLGRREKGMNSNKEGEQSKEIGEK